MIMTTLCKHIVTGLESKVLMRNEKTIIQARLKDLSVEDCSGDALYSKIITIEDETVFDLKVKYYTTIRTGSILYNETSKMCTPWDQGKNNHLRVFISQRSFHNLKDTNGTRKLCSH